MRSFAVVMVAYHNTFDQSFMSTEDLNGLESFLSIPNYDGVVDAAGCQVSVVRAPIYAKHVACMLP